MYFKKQIRPIFLCKILHSEIMFVLSVLCKELFYYEWFSCRTPVKGHKPALKDCEKSEWNPSVVKINIHFLWPKFLGHFNVQKFLMVITSKR